MLALPNAPGERLDLICPRDARVASEPRWLTSSVSLQEKFLRLLTPHTCYATYEGNIAYYNI